MIQYDAIVVGAGMAGGWVAKELTEAGFKVMMFDSGPPRTPREIPARITAAAPRDLAAGQNIQSEGPAARPDSSRQFVQARHPSFWSRGAHLFVSDLEHPYQTPEDKPFFWIRGKQVGGRSLVWGGTSLRFSENEFSAPTFDGIDLGWPIGYSEISPFYDRVEHQMGLCGRAENVPELPDSHFTFPPAPLTPAETHLREIFQSQGKSALDVRFIPEIPGLDGWPRYTAQGSTLAIATQTGRLNLEANCVVEKILLDETGARATGVSCISTQSGQRREVRARLIYVCAGTIESARLLLNSKSPRHPQGLGNNHDLVGRHLMDHPVVSATVLLPKKWGPLDSVEFSIRQRGVVIPPGSAFPEHARARVRPFGIWAALQRFTIEGRSSGNFSAQGEMLPYRENRITLGTEKDAWGIPIPTIECGYGDHEKRLAEAMQQALGEVTESIGAKVINFSRLSPPGINVHEVGTARMGTRPENSVVNASHQIWECRNVFVSDGASFPSAGWQNISLTVMALAARAGQIGARLLRN